MTFNRRTLLRALAWVTASLTGKKTLAYSHVTTTSHISGTTLAFEFDSARPYPETVFIVDRDYKITSVASDYEFASRDTPPIAVQITSDAPHERTGDGTLLAEWLVGSRLEFGGKALAIGDRLSLNIPNVPTAPVLGTVWIGLERL